MKKNILDQEKEKMEQLFNGLNMLDLLEGLPENMLTGCGRHSS